MAIVYGLFLVQVKVAFEDLSLDITASLPEKFVQSPTSRLPVVLTCATVWYLGIAGVCMAASEVYVVNESQYSWDLSIGESALLAALLMLCAGLINLFLGRFGAPYLQNDRSVLLVASSLVCLACIPLFNFGAKGSSGFTNFTCGSVAMVLTFAGVIRAAALSVSSKLVPPHLKTSMVSIAMVAQTLGRGFGAIVGAVVDQDSFAALMLGAFIATLFMCVASYPYLHHEAEAIQK